MGRRNGGEERQKKLVKGAKASDECCALESVATNGGLATREEFRRMRTHNEHEKIVATGRLSVSRHDTPCLAIHRPDTIKIFYSTPPLLSLTRMYTGRMNEAERSIEKRGVSQRWTTALVHK